MPRIVALYRYPVKGLTPEHCESLTVQPDGRIEGDRVLAFRFASTPEADDAWSSKHGMLVLVNTPGLSRLRVRYDEDAERLRLDAEGRVLADEALDSPGRKRLCDAITAFALQFEDNPLADRPDHIPLRLVGDGHTSRYQDSASGGVSLHGRASLAALGEALGEPELSEVRFRSNIAIEGTEPWEELSWEGRELRVGSVRFLVEKTLTRCLATHANPETGARDVPVLTTLTREFGQAEPTFAVRLATLESGVLKLGDEVEVLS
jgi:uncharacterized protein YcbX